jgi:hypothetical protein
MLIALASGHSSGETVAQRGICLQLLADLQS